MGAAWARSGAVFAARTRAAWPAGVCVRPALHIRSDWSCGEEPWLPLAFAAKAQSAAGSGTSKD